MSDPFAGLLEGLSEGFQTGHEFRENAKDRRRRRKLEEDLQFLRQQQERRAQAGEERTSTEFAQGQREYQRVQDIRSGTAKYLSAGDVDPATPGVQRPQLTGDLLTRQRVGKLLGSFGGREDLDEAEQLLVGTGEVPTSLIQPRAYAPRTRDEYMRNQRELIGLRGANARGGRAGPDKVERILRHANRLWQDGLGDYETWDDALAEAVRQVGDVEAKIGGGKSAPAGTSRPSYFGGGGGAAPVPAGGGGAAVTRSTGVAQPDAAERGSRIDGARRIIEQYRMLPHDQLEAALKQFGYSQDEINEVLGTPVP